MRAHLLSISLSFLFLPFRYVERTLVASAEIGKPIVVYSVTDNTATRLYNELQLSEVGLSKQAFEFAYKGYEKLLKKQKLANPSILTICDLSQSSNRKRLYILDLEQNKVLLMSYVAHEKIKTQMHWRNVFIHPTVMFRSNLIKQSGYYPTNFSYAEDYAFFWKLIKITSSHILSEFLVTCEINEEGLSFKNRSEQLLMQLKIIDQHGTNRLMKIVGMFRLKTLYILPKRLALPLKQILKRQ